MEVDDYLPPDDTSTWWLDRAFVAVHSGTPEETCLVLCKDELGADVGGALACLSKAAAAFEEVVAMAGFEQRPDQCVPLKGVPEPMNTRSFAVAQPTEAA